MFLIYELLYTTGKEWMGQDFNSNILYGLVKLSFISTALLKLRLQMYIVINLVYMYPPYISSLSVSEV